MKKIFKLFCLSMIITGIVMIPVNISQGNDSIEFIAAGICVILLFGFGFVKLNTKPKDENITSNHDQQTNDNDEIEEHNYGSSIKTSFDINEPIENVVRCPKCGSTSVITTNKKLSVKRAVAGTVLINPVAGAVGAVTSKKMYNVCQKCGYRWKLK